MSGLIIEIQQGCLNDSISVESLLRRVKVAAVKLKLKLGDLEAWVDNELNGYPSDEIPEHRLLRGQPMAQDPINGWISVRTESLQMLDRLSTAAVKQSISGLRDLVSKESDFFYWPLPPELLAYVNKYSDYSTAQIVIQIPRGSIIAVLDFVRNKVLDWSLEMERNGVLGEGLTFNEKEIESAKTIMPTIQIGNIENFAENIGEGNTSGDITLAAASMGDIHKIMQQLREDAPGLVTAGASSSLPDTIDAVIAETKKSEPDRSKIKVLVQGLHTALAGAAGNLTAEGAIAAISGIAKTLGGG